MPVVKLLKEQYGVISANVNKARGTGRMTPLAYRGVGEQTEKEILTVVVAEEQSDELFEFIYFNAKIDRPHGGLMYMSALKQATPFSLPDLPKED